MVVSFFKKINLIRIIWGCIPKVPLRSKLYLFIKPLESTRYTEIAYIINFIKKNYLDLSLCLDISSPFILSYILSKNGKVIKTDISQKEKKFVKDSKKLKFEVQNALSLTYLDNTFNFVYSISVIEHIYQGLQQSVNEMIRVTKPGGYIYISFPVSSKYQEEWHDHDIYSNQFIKDNKIFFQYRLDKKNLDLFLCGLNNVIISKKDIYWERTNGSYNKMIGKLKKNSGIKPFNFLINSLINLYYGFTLLNVYPEDFNMEKDFGNISIILKKKV